MAQTPTTIRGSYIQRRFGSPTYKGPQGLGVSGTTGEFGQLGPLAAYQAPQFKYTDVTDPTGMTSDALAAWRASQYAGQERQRVLQAEQARRRQIERGYGDLIGTQRRFGDIFDEMYSGYGGAQREALERDRQQQLARAYQSAQRRGLGNTTIRESLGRGVESAYQQQRTALEDQLTQNRINLMAQNLGQQQQLGLNRLNFLTNIEDQGPTFEQVMGYSMMPAQIQRANEIRAWEASQAKSAAKKQQRNSLISAGLTGAGYLLGGPLGGMAAGALSNQFLNNPQEEQNFYGGGYS